MLNSIKVGFIVLLTLFTSLNVQAAGGIALGATRVIYPSAAKQTSLAISNSDTQERYLVNSWIENNAGQKEKTFIVTPPLFVSEPKSENTLRIIYAGQPLPGDRESLFWMNVKAIPSVDKSHIEGKNVLQLAILSRIKLFVRPANLPQTPEDAPTLLKFSRVGNHLKITNPSATNTIATDAAIKCRWRRATTISATAKKAAFRSIFRKIWGITGHCIFPAVNKITGIRRIPIPGINWDTPVDGKA